MNQFKSIFLSRQNDKYTQNCVVNYQKCIRVGGKHNDLSDVGHDTYHHTFFEMLGNWSFNNAYFKRQACTMAYDLLTRAYKLDKNRLFFTYFRGEAGVIEPDYETKQIWIDLGVSPDRILPFGMKENFWEMGDTGPCGPCTEIHYDHTGQADSSQVNSDNPRVVELWNLVFMQYERRQDKSLVQLRNFHVDTGMGLERLVAVLNSFESNYDTDLFTPIFDKIHSYCPKSSLIPIYSQADKSQQYAYRLLADHARMFTIAIGDGLVPDKKGIGGLLKKMIERSARIAHENLHIDEENVAVLSKLIPVATDILSCAYPNLKDNLNRTIQLVEHCELNYMKKYKLAKPLLEKYIQNRLQKSDYSVTGSDIFRLYSGKIDNINVPLEMIEDYTRLFPLLKVDWTSFENLMKEETNKSKMFSVYNKAIKSNENRLHHPKDELSDFIKKSMSLQVTVDEPYKYQDDPILNSKLESIIKINDRNQCETIESIEKDTKYYIILDKTNFYSTNGGQSCDYGLIKFKNNLQFQVENVFQLDSYVFHFGSFLNDGFIEDKNVTCHIDRERRLNLSRNHTTTHLLHKVLHEILDDSNLIQKASLIHDDYFIFEYSSMNLNQKDHIFEQVETRMKQIIDLNLPITISSHKYDSIYSDKTVFRLSNEVYPSNVRCVNIGSSYSRELCCGTHIQFTKDIEDFVIIRADAKGQSNKRLYCVTGSHAKKLRHLFENDFLPNFNYLEENRNRISIDELYSKCRNLREIYLDERSLLFPFNQRSIYVNRLNEIMPDKKKLKKYFLNQLSDKTKKNIIKSNFDLPIYDIGYILLRAKDENNSQKSHSFIIYVNSNQNLMMIYIKNPQQREKLIDLIKNQYGMSVLENFDTYDEQTRELFTITKKLIIFQPFNDESFDKIDFLTMSDQLVSIAF